MQKNIEEMLSEHPEYAQLTPENHNRIQTAPFIGAGIGGLAGSGLGALFAKLTGKVSPLMGLGMGAVGGALAGNITGKTIRRAYNDNMTPEEAEYLARLDPNLTPMVSPDRRQPLGGLVMY